MDILSIIRFCTLPGTAGGLVLFLYSLKRGHYRNNKYPSKFSIETFGAMITATCIASLLKPGRFQIAIAFLIGVGWSGIVQTIRTKLTRMIEAVLSDKISEGL